MNQKFSRPIKSVLYVKLVLSCKGHAKHDRVLTGSVRICSAAPIHFSKFTLTSLRYFSRLGSRGNLNGNI